LKNYTESDDQLTLTWQDNSTNEDNFGIERKTGTSGTCVQIALAPANARSYPDSNVNRGVTYCYRVDALTAPEHQIILLTKHVRLFHKLMLINTDQLGGPMPPKIFKLIFFSVMTLTVLSLAVTVCLLFSFPNPSEEAKRLIETCSTTWKLGFGAILGLIGGKTFL